MWVRVLIVLALLADAFAGVGTGLTVSSGSVVFGHGIVAGRSVGSARLPDG